MHRIACNFPPARRAAYAISMSHDQRPLVLRQAASVDLPITDVVLPGAMTARELAGEAQALFPDLAVP